MHKEGGKSFAANKKRLLLNFAVAPKTPNFAANKEKQKRKDTTMENKRKDTTKESRRMPAIFVGHGSPMLALDNDKVTDGLKLIGKKVIAEFGTPKAILMLSAHWYKSHNLIQKTDNPKQVFDMYGFPQALYEVDYKPRGCAELSDAVLSIQDIGAKVDNTWGIDHGTWTPLVHMFPAAAVPVVQLSVNGVIGAHGCYDLGKKLAPLREQGYLVMGSGNVVHNLRRVDWDSHHCSTDATAFNSFIVRAVERRDDEAAISYRQNRYATYAAPTADHFLPLLYILGASQNEMPLVFNNVCTLDAIAMTSFAFGM